MLDKNKLPKSFKKNGFEYRLIASSEHDFLGIYEVSRCWKPICYEVLIFREKRIPLVFDKRIIGTKTALLPPSNEEFGTWGWSFQVLKNAQTKFLELMRDAKNDR